MFYNFLAPLASEWTLFNVFRYISFRSMAALITALVLSILVGPRFIAWLRRLKCGQYIHEDVAAHAAKAGTPTMGGLLMLFTLGVSLLLWADLTNPHIWQTFFVFVGFGAVGLWDDLSKLRHHKNKGISARAKFGGQILVAFMAMWLLVDNPSYSSRLIIPFIKEWTPDLGWLYVPFGMFVMVAASNAVNLTDGLDGLAIGPSIVACLVFSIFIYITGNARFAGYLLVPYMPGVGEVTVFCAALVGGPGLSVVQRLSGPGFHGRRGFALHRRSAGVSGAALQAGAGSGRGGRPVRGRNSVRDPASGLFSLDGRQAHLPHGAAAPSF